MVEGGRESAVKVDSQAGGFDADSRFKKRLDNFGLENTCPNKEGFFN